MTHANEGVLVYYNNKSTLTYTKDPNYHSRSKSIDFGITTFKMLSHKKEVSPQAFIY